MIFDVASRALANDMGFKISRTLEILGVIAHFDSPWRLIKFQVRKTILRLHLLKWTSKFRHVQQLVLSALVTPCFAWASGFARPDPGDMRRIRAEVIQVFSGTFTTGPARALLFEAIGWQLEPNFACDLGTMRILWKFCAWIWCPSMTRGCVGGK